MKNTIALLALFLVSSCAVAQSAQDSLKVFSLNYLIENAVSKNSKIEPLELQRRIELIKKNQVNKQPMPMFEAMIDYVPLNFMDKPEYSMFYSQRLLSPEKLNANEQISQVNAGKQDIFKEQLKLDITRQIKSNYFNVYYYDRLLQFNSEFRKINENIIKSLELSYSSGMGSQNQIFKMNNELQMLDYEKIELESARQVYVNNLRVLSNINLPNEFKTTELQAVLESFPEIDSAGFVGIMVSNNPEFKMFDNMVEEARIEKNIAELDNVPDILIRGGYRYMASEPMSYLTLGVAIDLPFMPWNKNRINAMIEEKTAMELRANSLRNSSLQYMSNELQSMFIMISSMKKKLAYLNEVLIPQTEQTFSSTITSYSSGSGDFMNLLDTYRKLRETSQMKVKEETELLRQYAELEFLLGKQLTTSK